MTKRVYPNITAVNDRDEVVGYFQLFDVLGKEGVYRRISAVFLVTPTGDVLIQRRAALVLSPNLLDFSAAGHVNEGDDYYNSAETELQEELGIRNTALELVTEPFKVLDHFVSVYKAVVPKDVHIVCEPDEVASVQWVPLAELNEMVERHPSQFTAPFLAIWPHVRDKICV